MRRKLDRMTRKAVKVAGLDTEWRECRCGARFRPAPTISGKSTEYSCSAECALAGWKEREHEKDKPIPAQEEDDDV